MFDFPDALGPNRPTDFRIGIPFHSNILCLNSRANVVLILAARKSILRFLISSYMGICRISANITTKYHSWMLLSKKCVLKMFF